MVEAIPDSGDKSVRRGIGYWVLGRSADAIETLKGSRATAAEFVRAQAHLALGQTDAAMDLFERLRGDDTFGAAARVGTLACLAANADFEALAKAVKALPKAIAESADGAYFQGRLLENDGDHEGAIAKYERALELDASHRHALFRLAYELDLRGMEDEAQRIYEKLVTMPPVDVAAVMNLGVLYEDQGDYARAIACFDAALRSDPLNARARLYKRDAEAALTMYYDETQERKDDKLQQTLRIPITDFELSVRARNCLSKMNIRTLGDLVRKTESELLSYKNFGETSLNEIKAILASKNLRLGMLPPEKAEAPVIEITGGADVLSKSISDLDLSVRSRRTVDALNITLVGDLLQHTPDELLAMPNFGQTSLNEIRMKLRQLGLDLRDTKGAKPPGAMGGLDDVDEDAMPGADDDRE
ncbi:MAG TPA: DNA-directed RNA polymerase subunit alpha C-terminal domain-containing protein [Planctomycetota bacterium]|nr:DNA-directed RNA polymerase subunit alpha C-terminal domain-containing protein [Planctomycetota bacterium]